MAAMAAIAVRDDNVDIVDRIVDSIVTGTIWSCLYVDTRGKYQLIVVPLAVGKHYSAFTTEVKYSINRHYKGMPGYFPIRRETIDYDDGGEAQRLKCLLELLNAAVVHPVELYANPIVLNDRVLTSKELRALLVRFGASETVLEAFNRHTWNRRISLAAAEN